VGTTLLNLSVLHYNDLVGVADRAQSVSDNNNGLLARADELVKRLLNLVLALGVEGRGGFVEQEQLGLADESASDSHALLLATRELHAALAHDRLVHERKQVLVVDEVVSVGLATSIVHKCFDLIIVHAVQVETVSDVLTDCAREQDWLLLHNSDLIVVPLGVEIAHIFTVEEDAAFLRVVKSLDQGDDR